MLARDMDRRALIVGSWLASGREPSHQKIRGLTERWKRLLSQEGDFAFGSLNDASASPEPLLNPKISDLTNLISDDAEGVTDETELLFYFVGHSVVSGKDDIQLILREAENGEFKSLSMSFLLKIITTTTPIKKIVIILDCCHSGCAKGVVSEFRDKVFVMFASGSEYAFDANFSECLLKSLEQPIRKSDQRIDRRNGGITYKKIFEDARRRFLRTKSAYDQQPECYGDYGGALLKKMSLAVPRGYNEFAPRRSVYGRLNYILTELQDSALPAAEVRTLSESDIFLTRKARGADDTHRYVSLERISAYLEVLQKIGWVNLKKGIYEITNNGKKACDDLFFNELLLKALEKMLGEGVTYKFIDDVINDLLNDMIPPTPVRIQERAAMKGVAINLDASVRTALQLLTMSGRFLKGSSDAIYPAEFPAH